MKRGTSGIYLAGFLQGAVFVLIPALGSTLRSAPYNLSSATYGMLYFPEIIGAILAALAAGSIHARIGGGGLFRLGALCNGGAMALLTAAYFTHGLPVVWLLLAETLMLGIGFGLTNTAINRAASLLFSGHAAGAVTLLNALIGGATAVSPIVMAGFAHHLVWVLWPVVLLAGWLILLVLPTVADTGHEIGGLRAWHRSMLPFAAAVLVYAICEGSFASWANVLISVNRGLPAADGALALSLFWAGMTAVRIILGAIPDAVLPRRPMLLLSPIAMAACFLAIPHCQSASALIALFAAAGMACGVYYPYSMAYGIAAHGEEGTQMAGLLVGALMVGEGVGSFGLGPLQQVVPLGDIYTLSVVWALPLVWLAWRNSRAARKAANVRTDVAGSR